ncbi:MAG: nucleotidyltransferase family protein [Planctomycetes bacterium]|nr:nucleotidyltransferase family protein [Planctomycetota bacterium]
MTRALVLAAGKSTRIREVAGDRPKPLLEVAGRSALAWNLRWLAVEGVREVWLNLHYGGDRIREAAGDGAGLGLAIRYSPEDPILGTAGAVRRLEAELGGADFLVLYGDNVTRASLTRLLATHRARGAVATLGVFDRDTTPNSGIAGGRVLLGPNDRVTELVEGRDHPSPIVSAGVYALSPSIFRWLPPDGTFADFARDVFPALLAAGEPVFAHRIEGFCFGLDTPEAFRRAEALLQKLQFEI